MIARCTSCFARRVIVPATVIVSVAGGKSTVMCSACAEKTSEIASVMGLGSALAVRPIGGEA